MRLEKDRRVRKRQEYRRIQNGGLRVSTPHFVLLVAPNPDPAPARLGITASRKVGGAVRRNRLKRLVREAFRAYPDVVPAGYDLVVICKGDDADLGRQEVISEWKKANPRLQKALRSGRTPEHRGRPSRSDAKEKQATKVKPSQNGSVQNRSVQDRSVQSKPPPDRTPPDRTPPDRTPPDRTLPDRTPPDRTLPNKTLQSPPPQQVASQQAAVQTPAIAGPALPGSGDAS